MSNRATIWAIALTAMAAAACANPLSPYPGDPEPERDPSKVVRLASSFAITETGTIWNLVDGQWIHTGQLPFDPGALQDVSRGFSSKMWLVVVDTLGTVYRADGPRFTELEWIEMEPILEAIP